MSLCELCGENQSTLRVETSNDILEVCEECQELVDEGFESERNDEPDTDCRGMCYSDALPGF